MLFNVPAETLTCIRRATNHQLTFVRLAKIDTYIGAIHHHINKGFDRL